MDDRSVTEHYACFTDHFLTVCTLRSFRPAYLLLGSLKRDFPGVPIAAATVSTLFTAVTICLRTCIWFVALVVW